MNVLDNIDEFNKRFKDATPEKVLRYFLDEFGDRIALSSSLSIEDQTLTDILLKINPKARIFTLDTISRLLRKETWRRASRIVHSV